MKSLKTLFIAISLIVLIQIIDGVRVIVQLHYLKKEKEQILTEMAYLTEKIDRLRRLYDYYRTPAGIEALVRRELDYVGTNEIIVIKGWKDSKVTR